MRLYYTLPEELIALACSRIERNLTRDEWGRYMGSEPYRATCPDLPMPEGDAGTPHH